MFGGLDFDDFERLDVVVVVVDVDVARDGLLDDFDVARVLGVVGHGGGDAGGDVGVGGVGRVEGRVEVGEGVGVWGGREGVVGI